MPPLIDTHVHFDDDRFDQDRKAVYTNAIKAGVSTLIIPATTRARWEKITNLSEQFENVYATAGLHPVFIDEHSEGDLEALALLLEQKQCIAVGECGLDGFIKELDYEKQRMFFERQLDIAATSNLPTIVHARNAVQDVIQSIKTHGRNTTGVIHSYNGSLEQAKQLFDLGYLLSFGGAITYDRATRLRKMVKVLPLESIMVETDAPDQTGLKHTGTRNEPAYLGEVVDTIAALKDIRSVDVASHSNDNACRLFGI